MQEIINRYLIVRKIILSVLVMFSLFSSDHLFAQDKGDKILTGKTVLFPQDTAAQTVNAPLANPPVVISSYYTNAGAGGIGELEEWTELLVTSDNTNITNWTFRDNNNQQNSWQPAITFSHPTFWNNLRAGTIIIIWNRANGASGPHPVDDVKSDGYIELSAQNTTYFSGGNFSGGTLMFSQEGDLLQLRDNTGAHIHALGHRGTVGNDFNSLPVQWKLNHKNPAFLLTGDAVSVSPGNILARYGNMPPLDGTTWTIVETSATFTLGLPNAINPLYPGNPNSDYWRGLRQPGWSATPNLAGTVDMATSNITLTWNAADDPNSADGTQGYIILRSNTLPFGTPKDGYTYTVGNAVTGGGTVIAVIPSSQTITYTDNTTTPFPCADGYYYQIFAYRYGTDNRFGNDFNLSRGRSYNTEPNMFGSAHITFPAPVDPATATSDRNNICPGDPGNITLSSTGGSGTTLKWYVGGCGTGTSIGTGVSLTIPAPSTTTTYYVRWETPCGNSGCASVTVTVLPALPVSVTITSNPPSPVCAGTMVTFTATPVNGGATPSYQWKVNGGSVGTNSPTYTYAPANNDNITVELTSNAACPTGNPATSNTIIYVVNPLLPVSCTITPSQDPVCPGTQVTYSATPVNGGTNPTFAWHVNGGPTVSTAGSYTYIPVAGDVITCVVTSDATCISGNPATGSFIPTFSNSVLLGVTITGDPEPVCTGSQATYTAETVNGGTNPTYEWHVNGGATAGTNSTYTYTPSAGDNITCIVNSNAGCVTNNPQTGSFVPTFTSSLQLSVSITASEDPVCQGTPVTYTAAPVNGGTTPTYEWHVNGGAIAGTNSTYTYTPADGDVITCIVNSSEACVSNNPQTGSFTATVSTNLVVSVSITASEDPVCTGTQVTYTAHPVNGGSSPTFDWFRTGVSGNVGTGDTYTCIPNPGDVITCILTSNSSCVANPSATATFNPIVTNSMVMTIAIQASQNPACQGTSITYTSRTTNGGTAPVFQWFVNGTVVSGTDSTYSYIPAPSDIIKCIVTSSSTCTSNSPDSNFFYPSIIAPVNVTISVTGDPLTVCEGTEVTFTADTTNAGPSPDLEWFVDGISVQSGPSNVYKTSALTGGESVTCKLTSSLACVVTNPVTSLPVTVSVSPGPHVQLTNEPYLCSGSSTQLDAGPDYTSYQWQDGSTGQYFTADDVGLYWVRVTDTAGCSGGSDTVVVKVCETGIYVPSAFSPNYDGINDVFKAVATLDANTSFTLTVVNRWGQTIFESHSFSTGWDGTYDGELQAPGVYAWKIVYQSVNSTETATTLKGTVTLLR